jgi:hypothetical protein
MTTQSGLSACDKPDCPLDWYFHTETFFKPDCPPLVNWTVRLWRTVRLLLTGLSVKLKLFTQKFSSNRTVRLGRFLPCNPSAGHIMPPHLFICSHPPKITSPLSFPHLTPQDPLLQKSIFGRIRGPSASIPGHSAIPSCLLGIPSSCPLGIESNPPLFLSDFFLFA